MGQLTFEGWFVANTALRALCFVLSASFVWRYRVYPWRRSPEGRHLMTFAVLIGLVMLWATFNDLMALLDPGIADDGYYPGKRLLATLVYLSLAYVLWRRNRLLSNEKRIYKKEQDDER